MFFNKIFCFSILVLCSMFGKTVYLEAADLHLIITGDLAAEDLQDGIQQDLLGMAAFAQKAADQTGLNLITHSFLRGEDLPNRLIEGITQLEVQSDDVMIFYYSGHGYRPSGKEETPWPNMYFTESGMGVELDLVIDILSVKHPRLLFITSDSCNSVLPDILSPPLAKQMQAKVQRLESFLNANYKKLFLETKGTIIVASSRPGLASYSEGTIGGFYTFTFLNLFDAFLESLPTEDVNWPLILAWTAEMTDKSLAKYGIAQEPIFTVEEK